MSYNNIINHITNQEDEDIVWKLKRMIAHEGPLKDSHPESKGYYCNIMV